MKDDFLKFCDKVDDVISFIKYNRKFFIILFSLVLVAVIISGVMTSLTVKYRPLYKMNSLTTTEKVRHFSSSMECGDSILESSIMGSVQSGLKPPVKDMTELFSSLSDANGGSGKLVIPEGVSVIEYGDFNIYGWEKSYKVFLNQIDCVEMETVWIVGNKAISGKIFAGFDFGNEVKIYELNDN